ncbi:MAG: hypothetical protein KGJ13_13165, partial [Patescibacteria group bacterium]|nr:hypothetical protein [Patescibacteria group bacterium]
MPVKLRKEPVADISAEERYYSRSLKIRLGVADCLGGLSDETDAGRRTAFDSMDELAGYAANHILLAKWDRRPASSVTCGRWVRQFILPNGLFKLDTEQAGGFSVSFRNGKSRSALKSILRDYSRQKPRKGASNGTVSDKRTYRTNGGR